MSGVQTGSRLERLYLLQRQVTQEIAVLEREAALTARTLPRPAKETTTPVPPRPRQENTVDRLLKDLGVTAHDVKTWALTTGLISEIRRGRVAGDLVTAYAAANPNPEPEEGEYV